MRVMVIVKANKDTEAGVMPSEQLLREMGNYNEQLVNAGIMLAGEGLKPSAQGKRIAFDGPSRTVIDGPFAETRELVAGFWLWQVKDMAEAIAWVKRCPNPMPGPSEIEIRPVYEMADFAEILTPEVAEQEDRHRAQARREGRRRTGHRQDRDVHRRLAVDQVVVEGVANQLGAGGDAELLLDVGTVRLHRADAQE